MNIYDVLHALLDRVSIHDPAQSELLHDAVTAQAEGFKSAEEYRKDRAAKAPSAPTGVSPSRFTIVRSAPLLSNRPTTSVLPHAAA